MPDYDFYINLFGGNIIPADEFERLAAAAYEILSLAAVLALPEDSIVCRRAICYEAELLYKKGGINAFYNIDVAEIKDESLGGYSVNYKQDDILSNKMMLICGLPLSPVAYSYLQKLGLTGRVIERGV